MHCAIRTTGAGGLGGFGCRVTRSAPITACPATLQAPIISAVAARPCPPAARLWLRLGSEVVESLGGLGDGVGNGLGPIHICPAGGQLPYAVIAQSYPRVQSRL